MPRQNISVQTISRQNISWENISRSAGLELVPKRAPRVGAVNIILGIGMQPSDQKHDSSGQLSGR